MLKLAQGEFVTISRLESVFVTSPLVRQIYVYGNSERDCLLAVIVPTEEALRQATSGESLRRALGESLQLVARQAGLKSYEIPRDFLVEPEPFTVENGLLSEIRKNLRPQLQARYAERLERRYEQLAGKQQDALCALREAGPGQPVFEAVRRAAAALLGRTAAELSATVRLTDLGADSLAALSLSRLLQDIFEVETPAEVLLGPANDLRSIVKHIEAARACGVKRPSFALVHGHSTSELCAADLTLEKFIDAGTLETARRLPRVVGERSMEGTVLLTGANGYLGRFLCLDWLERLAGSGGRLICLVRGRDTGEARRRLDAAFDTGDPGLRRRYEELAPHGLDVLAGDLGRERLGLATDTWTRLAREVDLILHPGALVNHVLPYDQLFGPNVLGTAELIRLALTARIKPFTYLSTVGVADRPDPRLDESADIRLVSPVRTLGNEYATGYAAAKWAGEVLLREAHDTYGLPVTVLRSSLILAHRHHTGQVNVPDLFTRLLFSLAVTGIAPVSFYRTDAQGRRQRAHFDGLPVDFVAQAVNTLAARGIDGYQTYHVVNPYDDGISLDTCVDWLSKAGRTLHRIADYDDWFSRFEAALRALPELQRRRSLLPLLHAFRHPSAPACGSLVPSQRFERAVREARAGGEAIPHLSAELITKYLSDLRGLGLL